MKRRSAKSQGVRSAASLRGRCGLVVGAAVSLSLCLPAMAQIGRPRESTIGPADPPNLSGALAQRLEQPFLTEDEGKDLRIFHGVWRDGDLDTPARSARAALIRGRWNDAALSATGIDPLDRAEGMLRSGKLAEALETLPGDAASPRAVRIRCGALEALGRHAEAIAAGESIVRAIVRGDYKEPDEIVDAIRILAQRVKLAGPANEGAAAADFHAMMDALGQVRTRIDRQFWPAFLLEGELLYAKDNPSQAAAALTECLRLNPSCADAWSLLGQMSCAAFNFDNAERMALRLEKLAGEEDEPGMSPEACLIRARAALRQIDGAGALAEIERALAVYPRHPGLLASRCAAEAVRFEFEAAKARLSEFDAAHPGSPAALLAVGQALAEARQYGEAAAFLEQASERNPNDPKPLIDLGLLELQAGRDVRALAALERAFKLDPFNLRADNSLRMTRELQTYETVESEHFVVRYKPGVDAVLAGEMLPLLEENHRIVCGSQPGGIDHEPAQKTVIDLMPDHAWFAVRIAGMPQIHTIAASTGPVIAMESPREGAKHLGTYDWVRVVRHEYVHTVTLSRTNNRIPHWFTEAAAVHLELAPRDFSTCLMLAEALRTDQLFDFDEINLAFIRPKKPTDRGMAYAQGHWMYEFLIERTGSRAPLELMDLYAQGVREEQAFQTVVGVSRAQFLEEFKLWARQQAIAWGMVLPEGTPTLRDLLVRALVADPAREAMIDRELQRAASDAAMALADVAQGEASGSAEPWTLELALPPRAQVDALLSELPTHPELLEVAVDAALAETNGRATQENAELLERYAAARPVDPKPHRLLAQLYLDSGEPQRAIPHLEYLDAREQKTPAYASELARRFAAQREFRKALSKAERATQLSPYDARPRELAATVAIQAGELGIAERHIAALTVLEPDRAIHRERLEAVRKRLAAAEGR